MKLIFLTTAALFGFSILTHAHANEKKVDSPSVMDCNNYGNVLVKESGKALAEIGESPVDIRRTVEYYCMKGFRAANEAQSLDEIELWEMASLHELTGINYERDKYKSQVIKEVSAMAKKHYENKTVSE